MSDWANFWFVNGGTIHRLWKNKNYTAIRKCAETLPKLAWAIQQNKIDELIRLLSKLVEDIETPERLGLGTYNKEWTALNEARDFLEKIRRRI
jgi:hypothetical protein